MTCECEDKTKDKTHEDKIYVAPPPPRGVFMSAVFSALEFAAIGAIFSGAASLLGFNKGKRLEAAISSAVDVGMVGGIVGIVRGVESQKLHARVVENVNLHNKLENTTSRLSFVENVLKQKELEAGPVQK